jgi:hypothetical protein
MNRYHIIYRCRPSKDNVAGQAFGRKVLPGIGWPHDFPLRLNAGLCKRNFAFAPGFAAGR